MKTTNNNLVSRLAKQKKSRMSTLSDTSVVSKVTEWVSTGCPPLDIIMGGGIPVGRMTEIYGDTSTGKSLLANHILAETQAMGGTAILLDSETATDEGVMIAVGVDPDTLVYSIPDTIEEVYRDIEYIIDTQQQLEHSGLITIVWDSVAATSTAKEIADVKKKGMGAATMGIHARMISQLCRVINTTVAKHRLAIVFVNQTRQKIGVMFGPDKATFGGRAIGYYSSVRLEMKQIRRIKGPSGFVGIDVRVGVAKNKIARPFGMCEFPIMFDEGIDEPEAVLWWLKHRELVVGSSWKTLILPDGLEVKFQHNDWDSIYYRHRAAIENLMTLDYANE